LGEEATFFRIEGEEGPLNGRALYLLSLPLWWGRAEEKTFLSSFKKEKLPWRGGGFKKRSRTPRRTISPLP